MFWLLIWEFSRLYYCEMQNKVFVMCIIVEQGCFLTELRIAGNGNKLIYFCKATSWTYSTKLLHIKPISLAAETLALVYLRLKVLETSIWG